MNFSSVDVSYVLGYLTNIGLAFYHSWFMTALKIFLGVYTFVLFADVVLLMLMRGIGSNIRVGLRGTDMPLVTPSKMLKRWNKVKARLETDSETQFKVAILEADAIADEILAGIGYEGINMGERLQQIKPGQLDGLEELISAHKVRNHIVHDQTFSIDKEMAKEVVEVYENFLRYLEFL